MQPGKSTVHGYLSRFLPERMVVCGGDGRNRDTRLLPMSKISWMNLRR